MNWSDYKITYKDGSVRRVNNVYVFEHLLASSYSFNRLADWDTIETTPKNYRYHSCYDTTKFAVTYKVIDGKPVEIERKEVEIKLPLTMEEKNEERKREAERQYKEMTGQQLKLF